jgi:hypothetical protein
MLPTRPVVVLEVVLVMAQLVAPEHPAKAMLAVLLMTLVLTMALAAAAVRVLLAPLVLRLMAVLVVLGQHG